MSSMAINWLLTILIILAFIGWAVWRYVGLRRAAKFIDNDQFKTLMHQGQIIDVRSSTQFHTKHILGARNFQMAQFKESLSSLRKDKPVLLYDTIRTQGIPKAVSLLKKAGFTDIYVLEGGFENWDGKTK